MKLKNIIAMFLSVATVSGGIQTVLADTSEYVNIALLKPCEASGYSDALYLPNKANDGVNANPQYSAWISREDEKAWWSVDLLLPYRIDYIEIENRKGNTDKNICDNIRVIASNDETFSKYTVLYDDKTAVEETSGVWRLKSKNRGKFRYVKIEKTEVGAVEFGEIRLLTYEDAVYDMDAVVPVEKSAGEDFVMPQDVTNDYEKSVVAAMNGLGILRPLSDNTFGMYNEVSRAELAKALCAFVGISEDSCVFDVGMPFTDVNADTDKVKYIYTAYQCGFVSGDSKKQFKPEDSVTVEEAVMSVVKALGYGDVLKANRMADDFGLLSGVTGTYSDVLTRYDLAAILYNALNSSVWIRQLDGTIEEVGVTALEKFHKAYMDKGVLLGDDRTQISSFINDIPEGMLYIDDIMLDAKGVDVNSYIGMHVEYIYTQEDGDNVLLSIVPTKKNQVTRLDSDEIDDFINDNLTYNIGTKTKSIYIPKESYIVYNGKAQPDKGREYMKPQNGYVRIIDNNGDGIVDVVFIYDAKIGLINWIDKENGEIYLKNTTVPIVIKDAIFSIYMDGRKISLDEVCGNDVIYIYQNEFDTSNRVITCDIFRKTLESEFTKYSNEYLTIDNTSYDYVKSNIDISKIKLSNVYTIYFGENDVIAAIEKSEAGRLQYGYLQKVSYNEDDEYITFKVFTESGTFAEFMSASKVVMDGYRYKTYQEMTTHLDNIKASKGRRDGLIKYIINKKNEITHLDTTEQGPNEDEDALSDVVYTANNAYYKSSGIIGGQYDVSNAVVFYIPSDISKDRDYSVGSTSGFMHNSQHSFKGYDSNEKRQLGVLLSDGSVTVEESEAISIVVDTSEVLTDDDEIATEVVVYRNGELTAFLVLADTISETFEVGDLCQFTVNEYNEIVNVVRIYSQTPTASDKINLTTNIKINSLTHGNLYAGYGTVLLKNGNNFAVEMKSGTVNETYMGSLSENGACIYVYDSNSKRNAVSLGSIEDLRDVASVGEAKADKVIFRTKAADLKEVFILR